MRRVKKFLAYVASGTLLGIADLYESARESAHGEGENPDYPPFVEWCLQKSFELSQEYELKVWVPENENERTNV